MTKIIILSFISLIGSHRIIVLEFHSYHKFILMFYLLKLNMLFELVKTINLNLFYQGEIL